MATKDKKVFALQNFRGLDKENKPLKVAPFRATDGYNFIIDSDTLKTRPSFTVKKFFDFVLDTDETLIDYYNFRGVNIYISTKHFYFQQDGSTVVRNESTAINFRKAGVDDNLDFTGKRPIYKEEKNALFIFGLDKIYIYSVVFNEITGNIFWQFLYDLRIKPDNPFSLDDEVNHKFFIDLPEVYVPTIFVGDNAFEDLNNLSSKFSYEIFSQSSTVNQEGKNIYYLPTHYDQNKHTNFTQELEFYKGQYENINVFPLFLGIDGEQFDYDTDIHGSIINDEVDSVYVPVYIQDTYFPEQDFEYYDDGETVTPIKEIVGITNKDFFELRVVNDNTTVFEYILNQLQSTIDASSWVTNKVLIFSLPIEFTSIFKDPDTDFTISSVRQKDNAIVYLQLKKFEESAYEIENNEVYTSTQITSYTTSPSLNALVYPQYQTVGSNYLTLPNSPINSNINTLNVNSLMQSYLSTVNLESYAHNDKIYVKTQVYNIQTILSVQKNFSYYNHVEGDPFRSDSYPQLADYPAYPTFTQTSPTTSQVVESPFPTVNPNPYPNFQEGSFIYQSYVRAEINSIIDGLNAESGTFFLKKRFILLDPYGQVSSYTYSMYPVVYRITYTKNIYTYEATTSSVIYEGTILRNQLLANDNLFEVKFDSKRNAFELKVKNYFYDFRNEPSIKATFTLENNPDYDLIAKCTFGTTFGSENRLFLAGHPDYPNIDRYNVSNDLLGNNVLNQSYELSYFPSRNYRVLGGKGPINGYVVATDSQLYITKAEYPNDDMLFIRERILDENGVVGYREFKTNINKTPLNNRCIVRFYNDILILSKDGLYAIELASNVLTNERLLKLRSGFINKDLKAAISNATTEPFILENNYYMYIFIDQEAYVADSRYIDINPNAIVGNQSYEIVKWQLSNIYSSGHITELEMELIDSDKNIMYELGNKSYDETMTRTENIFSVSTLVPNTTSFVIDSAYDYIYEEPSKYAISFAIGYNLVAENTLHFTVTNNLLTVINSDAFRDVNDGDILTTTNSIGEYIPFTVSGFEASDRLTFAVPATMGSSSDIFVNIAFQPLYITKTFTYSNVKYLELSRYKPDAVEKLGVLNALAGQLTLYFSRFLQTNQGSTDVMFITKQDPVKFLWVSNVTDLGNNLMEKTMFRLNVYATKQEKENTVNIGFKTMRRLQQAEETNTVRITDQIDLSNPNSFDGINFLFYALNTFNETGTSIPAKENNFLYIQFLVTGEGSIELNSIQTIYKNNRMLKSIG